ncbi:MAG: dienelactone hydrolase family protein [Chloroflexi bacterium]|nr:dienelactone hydrolase family protein [Chloroflexota bacterium]
MPIYNPTRVEYSIVNGRVSVVADDGTVIPAYWSHPDLVGAFPAVCLVHDWWGISATDRQLAHLFAQLGYYVLIPDLFHGATASTPTEAMDLVRRFGGQAYGLVDRSLGVLEKHHRTNGNVGVVGFGMGGSLAYEAAILRPDLEAAVAFYGLPGRYWGRFKDARAPILAFYGSAEPVVKAEDIERMRAELVESNLPHEVVVLKGAARAFFRGGVTGTADDPDVIAWERMLAFLDRFVLNRR